MPDANAAYQAFLDVVNSDVQLSRQLSGWQKAGLDRPVYVGRVVNLARQLGISLGEADVPTLKKKNARDPLQLLARVPCASPFFAPTPWDEEE